MNNKRLDAIKKIFTNDLIIDIGSDHGYLPIELLKNDIVKKAIIIEVNQGPLENAIANVKRYGLNDKVRTLLSDGLQKLEIEAIQDAGIVIAGMGGKLISEIINNDLEKFQKAKLYLQANNNEPQLRRFLIENNFQIEADYLVKDEGIIYEYMSVSKGKQNLTEEEIMFGLDMQEDNLFNEKWSEQLIYLENLLKKIRKTGNTNQKLEIEYQLICKKLGVKNEIK